MNLFRKALETAVANECCRDADLIYFAPADQVVDIHWVERMAELEWECEETCACSHPAVRSAGCCFGQWVADEWICDALLTDSGVLKQPPTEIVKRIQPNWDT